VLRELRGNRIAMIFQEPMTSLNPLHTIEKQIGETLVHAAWAVKRRNNAFWNCWNWSAFRSPKSASRPIRISCPAASANG
jgi:ABC-type microcin C transport system duplicated ATPase subunit YejF